MKNSQGGKRANVRVLLLNGVAGSGKDSVLDILGVCERTNIIRVSSIDSVKKIATTCGWPGTKTDKDRKFLSCLKNLLTKFNEYPQRETIEEVAKQLLKITPTHRTFVGICAREHRDLDYFKEYYSTRGFPVTTILVTRKDVEENIPDNSADQGVFGYPYDLTLSNNSTLSSFRRTVENIFKE